MTSRYTKFNENLQSIQKLLAGDRQTHACTDCCFDKPTLLFGKKLTNSVAQEPEGSSPHSPQPATGPCPEPVESNPHPPSQI
jgi:hypothetical protein